MKKNIWNIKDIYKYNKLSLKEGEKTYFKFDDISNYNDEVYVYSTEDNNKYKITTIKLDNLDNYKKLYTKLDDKELIQITQAYSIPSSKSMLYIYFPKEKVNAKKTDKIYLTYECNINNEKNYHIKNFYGYGTKYNIGSIGNYYIEQVNFSKCDIDSNIIFSLIKIDK